MKLKGSIVRVERRKRIFLCEIQTIQLQTEQENPSYAESHKEWDSEQWEMLDKYQKKKGKISNAIIMSNFQNWKKNVVLETETDGLTAELSFSPQAAEIFICIGARPQQRNCHHCKHAQEP